MAERICFVIAPIGLEDSDTRRRSDQVLRHVIRPIVEECNYKALRADEIAEPGMITNQVIQHIVNDELVLADLTERNPNVFYELALRHAIRKPLIQIMEKGESLPFDVAGMRTIQIDHRNMDSVADAKAEIVKQIHAIEAKPDAISTPIEVAMYLDRMKDGQQSDEQASRILLSLNEEIVERLHRFEEFFYRSDIRLKELFDRAYDRDHHLAESIRNTIIESIGTRFAEQLKDEVQNTFASLMSKPDALQREIATTVDRQLKKVMDKFNEELEKILQMAAIRIDNRMEKVVRNASKHIGRGAKSP